MKFKGLKGIVLASSLFLLGNTIFAEAQKKKLVAVGDVMIARRLDPVFEKRGYEWPFSKVKDYLSNADIAFCNLEYPISSRGEKIPKEFNFRAKPEAVESLKYAGFDIVSLANNHCLDYDIYALEDTTVTLKNNNIRYFGLREDPVIIEKDGIKMAFIGYSVVNNQEFEKRKKVNSFSLGKMKEDIAKAKKKSDLVVISFHWEREVHKSLVAYQREYARTAIDSGADLILGHHPHVLQPIEKYKGKYIVYSMGNFVFGCNTSLKDSALFEFNYSKDKIELDNIVPININQNLEFRVQPYEGKKKEEIIDFLMPKTIREKLN